MTCDNAIKLIKAHSALRMQLAWVRHWQDDVKCNLMPTNHSLDLAVKELEETIREIESD